MALIWSSGWQIPNGTSFRIRQERMVLLLISCHTSRRRLTRKSYVGHGCLGGLELAHCCSSFFCRAQGNFDDQGCEQDGESCTSRPSCSSRDEGECEQVQGGICQSALVVFSCGVLFLLSVGTFRKIWRCVFHFLHRKTFIYGICLGRENYLPAEANG